MYCWNLYLYEFQRQAKRLRMLHIKKLYCNEFFRLHTFLHMFSFLGVWPTWCLSGIYLRMHVHKQNAYLWSVVRLFQSFKKLFLLVLNTLSVKTDLLSSRNKIKKQRSDIVCILLGISPASVWVLPTFRNPLSVPSSRTGNLPTFRNPLSVPSSRAGSIYSQL